MNAAVTTVETDTIARMLRLGCQLIRLAPGVKTPKGGESWKLNPTITTVGEALDWVAAGGGLGVDLARSGMICLDAEDKAATTAVVDAGLAPDVITAKGQVDGNPKQWGSHAWFRVPDGVDPFTIASGGPKRMGLELPKGGKIDVLSGVKYAVAPPTHLAETGTPYRGTQGGLLDLSLPEREVPIAPSWLFDPTLPAPPSLAPLGGCLEPEDPKEAYDRAAASAASIELTDSVDSVPWDQWLAGEMRLSPTGEHDTCGCPIYHWHRSDNRKSATLHDGCEKGCGAHVWSATMVSDLDLHGEHVSRLQLAAALRGASVAATARAAGIPLGGDREPLAPMRPEHFLSLAAEADRAGNLVEAERLRLTAEALLAEIGPRPVDPSAPAERFTEQQVVGGVPLPVFPEAATEPPAAEDQEIKRFPGVPLEGMQRPEENEIYEYPVPDRPSGVPPIKGARTAWAEVLPPIANRATHELVAHEWIFYATPGLSQVAAAADSRGTLRWGLLGAILPRIAAHIPATVRLTPAEVVGNEGALPQTATGAGTSLNIYSVLVGPPSSGKTSGMNTSDVLIPDVLTVPAGTGEGILKLFPGAPTDEGDTDASGSEGAPTVVNLAAERSASSVLLSSDEIDIFIAEMNRQGSKTSGMYRSMWMGGETGNQTSDKDRRVRTLPAHSYRFGIRLGAQPAACAPLFSETGKGTPQRFLWLRSQRVRSRGPWYPEHLQISPIHWFADNPSMLPSGSAPVPPIWIHPPAAAREQMLKDEWRSATMDAAAVDGSYGDLRDQDLAAAIADTHAVLMQRKISALLAVLDGIKQPQDVHWHAAGAIMAVRRELIGRLVEVSEAIAEANARKTGENRGIIQAAAVAEQRRLLSEGVDEAVDLVQRVFADGHPSGFAARGGAPISEVKRAIKKSAKPHLDGAVQFLVSTCGWRRLPGPGAATSDLLRPPPALALAPAAGAVPRIVNIA